MEVQQNDQINKLKVVELQIKYKLSQCFSIHILFRFASIFKH